MDNHYETLRLTYESGVMTVTFDNPPVNLMTLRMMSELDQVFNHLLASAEVEVAVFESADPEFFVAHGDMTVADDPVAFMELDVAGDQPAAYNPMMRIHEKLRSLPQLTIMKVRGFARGGGAELVSAADIRFGSEKAAFSQFEARGGIIPGGGGTAYLPRLIGRARALEVILGADLIDARTAHDWGWLNRLVDDGELDGVVDRFAHRVASLPEGVLSVALQVVGRGSSVAEDLAVANEGLGALFAKPAAGALAGQLLESGAQTRDGERQLETLVDRLHLS